MRTASFSNRAAWLAALLLGAGVAGWVGATAPAAVPAGHARPAAKAAQNLLLAGAQAGQRLIAVGEYGHVLLSDDQGKTWRQAASVPTVTTLTAVTFVDARNGWAVGHGGVVLGTQDAGEHWQLLAGKLDGKDVALSVWFKDTQVGVVVGAFGYASRTTDGGKSWQTLEMAPGEEGERHLNQLFKGPVVNGQASLWVAAESGLLFRSDDDGQHWTSVKLPYKGSIWGGTTLADGAMLVWGMRGHVLRSDDQGKTFVDLETGTDQSLGGGTALPEAGQVVLAGLGGVVLHSRDGGRHFTASVREDRSSLSTALPGAPGQVVLLGQAGALVQPLAAPAQAAAAASTPASGAK